ncbi:MAG: methylenetetrahydrofolate reductase C-terminal domain-containing protein [Thermodesulfobacteriota bacterium]
MLRVFRNDMTDPGRFVITLELIPGREHIGKSVDTVIDIARDAFSDGRISAVSMTDNPGGNPALSPDGIGSEIFKLGMDVIVHFTCRDTNRVGMESRALQLAMMGMKNILALTGDYAGKGFAGQGAPVFDLDSVSLQCLLTMLSERIHATGDPDGFFAGCAVSPFKYSEPETFAQYAKLARKLCGGADFIITQLGYDARKYRELLVYLDTIDVRPPVLGSVYILTPKVARLMNAGKVPGAIVTDRLLQKVLKEWEDPKKGRQAAIERTARLGVVLKGLGYKGIHIGGIHTSFRIASEILDRMAQIEDEWPSFIEDISDAPENGFYAISPDGRWLGYPDRKGKRLGPLECVHYHLLKGVHEVFFDASSPIDGPLRSASRWIDERPALRKALHLAENVGKTVMLDCRQCGDCAIQHVGFQCPESGCPKHTRNGACGGSRNGKCEVHPERWCIWRQAYRRFAYDGKLSEMIDGCIPPRNWELDRTSSWLNFHLGRDHQNGSADFAQYCCNRREWKQDRG